MYKTIAILVAATQAGNGNANLTAPTLLGGGAAGETTTTKTYTTMMGAYGEKKDVTEE